VLDTDMNEASLPLLCDLEMMKHTANGIDEWIVAEAERAEHTMVTYVVNLLQDGMLLGGSPEQTLRPEKPILNFYGTEYRTAAAIAKFLNTNLNIKLIETSDQRS